MQLLHNVNATLNVPIIPSQISLFLNGLKGKNNIEAVKTCTHTLVTHRVGYHYDVFSKGSDGIENKVLVELEGKGGNKDGPVSASRCCQLFLFSSMCMCGKDVSSNI